MTKIGTGVLCPKSDESKTRFPNGKHCCNECGNAIRNPQMTQDTKRSIFRNHVLVQQNDEERNNSTYYEITLWRIKSKRREVWFPLVGIHSSSSKREETQASELLRLPEMVWTFVHQPLTKYPELQCWIDAREELTWLASSQHLAVKNPLDSLAPPQL